MIDFAAFATARRPVQDRGRDALEGKVRWALHRYHKVDDWNRTLVNAAERLMRRMYRAESGRLTSKQLRQVVETFREQVERALDKTSDTTPENFEAKVKAITAWLSNAAINAGTMAAGLESQTDPDQPDMVKTWITMHDDRVREAHADVDGITVPIDEKFFVGGVLMSHPGDPSAPPDLTINCRCVLAVDAIPQVSTDEEQTATLDQNEGATMTITEDFEQIDIDVDDLDDATEADAIEVPWHGVLAPENVMSGDGRKFGIDSLRWRDLPLPLSWQKVNAAGHDGSVVVGRIDEVWREGNLIKASGTFLTTDESGEAIGLIAEGGIRGVSVDVDDATMELQNSDGTAYDMESASPDNLPVTVFPDGRICGATLCPIPAFAEAFVSLGDWESDVALTAACECDAFVDEGSWDGSASNYTDEQYYKATIVHLVDSGPDRLKKSNNKLPILTPSGQLSRAGVHAAVARLNQTDAPPEKISRAKAALRSAYKELKEEVPDAIKASAEDIEEFEADLEAMRVKTEDGPGWLTHPVDTERLRRYWTKGKGAAKIRWGTPGDFNRCRSQLAKYVKPIYLNGYCANRHYDATGFWPGKAPLERAISRKHSGDSVVLASVRPTVSARYFDDPQLTGPTPVTITDDDRIFGHLAVWGTCHVGMQGTCVTPPHSPSNYAHFRTGAVHTDEGDIAVGHVTLGTGHAGSRLSAASAAAHYDNTGTVAADVVAGEDAYGIWISGRVRDRLSDEDRYALASAPLSGDWRGPEGNREMVAALGVNVPGFLVPRIGIKDGRQVSLVAAGVLDRTPHVVTGIDISAAVMAAVDEIEFRKNRKAMGYLAEIAGRTPAAKMERLRELAGRN